VRLSPLVRISPVRGPRFVSTKKLEGHYIAIRGGGDGPFAILWKSQFVLRHARGPQGKWPPAATGPCFDTPANCRLGSLLAEGWRPRQ